MSINKFILVIISFFLFFSASGVVLAHPSNSTSTTLVLADTPAKSAEITIALNWVQLNVLVDAVANEDNLMSFLDFHFNTLDSYVKQKSILSVDDKVCTLSINKDLSMQRTSKESTDIFLIGTYSCVADVTHGVLNIDLFNEFTPTQNYVTISKLTKDGTATAIKGGVLSGIDSTLAFSSVNIDASVKADETSRSSINNVLVETFKSRVEETTLRSLILILLIAMVVGGLHALEGGHSKVILASFMVDKRTSLRDGLVFTSLFTLTHMSDLIVIGTFLLILNSFRDIYTLAGQIQIFAIYSMVFVSFWQLLKELSHFMKHRLEHSLHNEHHHDHNHDYTSYPSSREKFMLAFFEGLSPCLMGWTILFIVISTGYLWLLIPVLVAFASGIYLVLLCFMLLFYKFKTTINKKITWFSDYSGLISSVLLVSTALYLATQLL